MEEICQQRRKRYGRERERRVDIEERAGDMAYNYINIYTAEGEVTCLITYKTKTR